MFEDKILSTLIKLSVPIMGTAFIAIAYSLVDIIWIGRLSTASVAATGTSGVLIWFAQSLMLIPKVGMSVRASQNYGKGDYEKSKVSISTGFYFAIFISLSLTSIYVFFGREIISFFKLSEEVSKMAYDYLRVISYGFVFAFISEIFSGAYNSFGDSISPFRLNSIGLILNMILDPILIFGLFNFPKLGIIGAALASILSQMVVTILFFIIVISEKGITFHGMNFKKFSLGEMKIISKLGLPSFLQSGVQSIVAMFLNKFMALYGKTPVAVYSVGAMIESVAWMTTDGFQAALSAFTGQNFGAKHYDRIKGAFKVGILLVSSLGVLVALVFVLFGKEIFSIFIPNDPKAIEFGAIYLSILSISEPFMNIEIASTGIYNGISQTRTPGIIGVLGNILRIPISLLLMPIYGVFGVWIAVSLSSIIKGITSSLILHHRLKNDKFYLNGSTIH